MKKTNIKIGKWAILKSAEQCKKSKYFLRESSSEDDKTSTIVFQDGSYFDYREKDDHRTEIITEAQEDLVIISGVNCDMVVVMPWFSEEKYHVSRHALKKDAEETYKTKENNK